MPAGKIVEVCRAKRATVFRYLQVQCERYPELQVEHGRNAPPRRPVAGRSAWNRHFDELGSFLQSEGGWPKTNPARTAERALALWLVQRRSRYWRNQLLSVQRVRLDSLGEWMTPLRDVENDRCWHQHLAELEEFVAAAGRMPRYRRFEAEEERVLGVWLHVQHQKRGNGTLLVEKLRLLAAVPGWASHE